MMEHIPLIKNGVECKMEDEWIDANKDKTLRPKAIYIDNPLIAMIGISKYDGKYGTLIDLAGVKKDISTNIDLWNGYLNYDINILTDKEKHDKKITIKDAQKFLGEIASTLIQNNYDCLICILSGHGHNDSLITSDHQRLKLSAIQDMFNCESLPLFSNKPKIFCMDLCRGSQIAKSVFSPKQTWQRWKGVGPGDIHPDSDEYIIYSNTKKYQVPEDNNGSVMMPCLYDVFTSTNLSKHPLTNITTMVTDLVANKSSLLCIEAVSTIKCLVFFKKRLKKGKVNRFNGNGKVETQKNGFLYYFYQCINYVEQYINYILHRRRTLWIAGSIGVIGLYSGMLIGSRSPGFAQKINQTVFNSINLLIVTIKNIWSANKRQ